MNDYLLQLSQNSTAKSVIRKLGLPIPLPTPLRRGSGPWASDFLADRKVLLDRDSGKVNDAVQKIVTEAGGELVHAGDSNIGRPDALVVDATILQSTGDLSHVYDFLHPRVRSLSTSGRVLIVGTNPDSLTDPVQASVQEGLKGLVKSLGKELGKKGITTHLIYTESDKLDTDHLRGFVGFLLSDRSAFISGQTFILNAPLEVVGAAAWHRALADKVALVTGAAQGIGKAIATRLAEEGAKVICLDIDEDQTKEIAEEIDGLALPLNLLADDAMERVTDFCKTHDLQIDILVNNAGITRDKTLARMNREQWNDTIGVNLEAAVKLTQLATDKLMREGGRVICMSSISGIAGNMGQTNYATAKAGLIGFVHKSAPQLAERQITINAIAPGFIETRMTKAIPVAVREVARRFNALSQAGRPEDIAELTALLSGPMGSPLTGQTIRVCGLNLVGA